MGDEALVRGLELALSAVGAPVLARAANAHAVAEPSEASSLRIDVVIGRLDACGYEALRATGCSIVAVGDESLARKAIRSGAHGYVAEDRIAECLAPTLAAVLAGQLCVPRAAGPLVAPPVLSFREQQVLRLAAEGLTNSAIAGELFLSESTVKSHLSSSFRKLGVSSRAEATLAFSASTGHD